jgi:hypothetical protein
MKEQYMSTNYVLIDFENVQPKNLEILSGHPFTVLAFVGASQAKIPFALAAAMQQLGEKGRYIKIGGSGKNALDFHLAFYVGELAAKDPDAVFHIISKDTGFDPLIKHLRARKIRIQREKDLAEIPVLRVSAATSSDEKISTVLKNLIGRGQSRPRKVETLANTINSLFTKKLEEPELMSLVKELQKRGYIAVTDGNVTYKLPSET